MSESHLMGFLVLFLSFLPTASTVSILNSINDLKKIPFGQSVPQHSLVLLHWFANTIELSNSNVIVLTFDPNHRDYGSHPYHSNWGFLPYGPRYYTLGNINPDVQRRSLPSYFTNELNYRLGREVLNRARIIISLPSQHTIDRVYITQHYEVNQGQGSGYDPGHTYQISIDLLRELREFSFDQISYSELSAISGHFGSGIDNNELSSVRNRWGQLACVGLLLFIVINQRNTPCRPNRARGHPPKHNVRASATPQNYNNYRPPAQHRDDGQCLTACLALGFLAVLLIIAIAMNVDIRY